MNKTSTSPFSIAFVQGCLINPALVLPSEGLHLLFVPFMNPGLKRVDKLSLLGSRLMILKHLEGRIRTQMGLGENERCIILPELHSNAYLLKKGKQFCEVLEQTALRLSPGTNASTSRKELIVATSLDKTPTHYLPVILKTPSDKLPDLPSDPEFNEEFRLMIAESLEALGGVAA